MKKKLMIITPIIIAVVAFIFVYRYYNHQDKETTLTVSEKKWVQENKSKTIDIEVVNDYPIYATAGKGVLYSFISDMDKDIGLEFNEIPYLKTSKTSTNNLRFRVLDNDEKLTDKDLPLFSDYYRTVVSSYRDLPKLYNQWCSVLRWEKETRPFLRSREFLWQEGHTIHETSKEAEAETLNMLNIYNNFFHDYLAIPSIVGRKTEKEKFAGAEYTYTVESLMYNGIALQSATSHYFGQKFSKAYDIKFTSRENKLEYPYQTSWGASTRMMGALIMVHSDDYGLVLPPKIAPKKVVIIPIGNDLEVVSLANDYLDKLKKEGIEAYIDNSDKSPGFKFAEAEVNGIPVRIEIGKRDLENNMITLVRRDTREKREVFTNTDIIHDVKLLLEDIQRDMYDRALRRREEMTYTCTDIEEFKDIINNRPGFIKAMWCGNAECEAKIKEIRGCKSRCIPFNEEKVDDKCIVCGKPAKDVVIWGIQY